MNVITQNQWLFVKESQYVSNTLKHNTYTLTCRGMYRYVLKIEFIQALKKEKLSGELIQVEFDEEHKQKILPIFRKFLSLSEKKFPATSQKNGYLTYCEQTINRFPKRRVERLLSFAQQVSPIPESTLRQLHFVNAQSSRLAPTFRHDVDLYLEAHPEIFSTILLCFQRWTQEVTAPKKQVAVSNTTPVLLPKMLRKNILRFLFTPPPTWKQLTTIFALHQKERAKPKAKCLIM